MVVPIAYRGGEAGEGRFKKRVFLLEGRLLKGRLLEGRLLKGRLLKGRAMHLIRLRPPPVRTEDGPTWASPRIDGVFANSWRAGERKSPVSSLSRIHEIAIGIPRIAARSGDSGRSSADARCS